MISLKLRIVLSFLSVIAVLFILVSVRKFFPRPIYKSLDRLRVWWLGVAKQIGHIQTCIILFLVYFTGFAVTALIARCMRRDFLRLRESARWLPRKKKENTIETLFRQF